MASSSPYQPAAAVLNEIWERRVSFKAAIYRQDKKTGSTELKVSKTTYAIVCQVLQQQAVLEATLQAVPKLTESVHNQGLLYVLLYELLLGPNQRIQGGGAVKRKLLKEEKKLRQALAEAQKDTVSTSATNFPRYVRANTLKTSTAQVLQQIRNETSIDELYGDAHVPDLVVCPPGSTSQLLESIPSSSIVLQDKSSCLPALCLVHGFDDRIFDGDVLDACAAPGNKTSHLAALLATGSQKEKTTVYALDRSPDRLETLQRRMKELVPSNKNRTIRVEAQCQDFLQTTGDDYPSVRAILLDPTCSGSGIYTAGHPSKEHDCLDNLVQFQIKALVHALSTFPAVERVVYSTCSVNVHENEGVVAQALQTLREQEDSSAWEIVAPACLKHWKRRGQPLVDDDGADVLSSADTSAMVRVDREDETNGFFVCCLQRRRKRSGNKEKKRRRISLVSDVTDLPVYSGQFTERSRKDGGATQPSRKEGSGVRNEKAASLSPSAKRSSTKKRRLEAPPGEDKTNRAIRDETSEMVVSKKRAKKRAWKEQQKQKRLERLEKKKQKT